MSTLVGNPEIWEFPQQAAEPSNFSFNRREYAKQEMEVPVCDL
jgi:hypothetical protein